MMTSAAKQKLIAGNAAIWMTCSLLSFILPRICVSLSDGPANFLIAFTFAAPLAAGMAFSTKLISSTIGEPSE